MLREEARGRGGRSLCFDSCAFRYSRMYARSAAVYRVCVAVSACPGWCVSRMKLPSVLRAAAGVTRIAVATATKHALPRATHV